MKILALEYHDVILGKDFDTSGFRGRGPSTYKLKVDDFEAHLGAIAKRTHARPSSANDLLSGPLQGNHLLFTFDDGGVSAHEQIAIALEKRGWRGHFLITTDYIGKPSFLTREQIKDLSNRGHVIGSHSCSHPLHMANCTWPNLLQEWRDSVRLLSEILGNSVAVASVPGGYYSRRVAEAAFREGVRVLFTSEPTTRVQFVNQCLVIGRYTIRRWTSPQKAAAIAAGKTIPRLQEKLFYTTLKIAHKIGGSYYLKARKRFWAIGWTRERP